MSGGLETIERLISEADHKFLEKLRHCQAGGTVPNLSVLADRTYNLRQQVVHNATLMADEHFIEMLEEVEVCLAPEYTLKGDLDRKLYAFLAGLLKGLLREAIGVQSFAARKVQLEMTWHWYHDKKKHVLEFALDKLRPSTAVHVVEEADADASSVKQDVTQAESGKTAPSRAAAAASEKLSRCVTCQSAEAPPGAATARTQQGAGLRLKFAEEARRNTDQAAVAKKLALYKRRDLAKADKFRAEVRAATAEGTTRTDVVKVVYKRSKTNQSADGPSSDGSSVRLSGRAGPSGPDPYPTIPGSGAPKFNPPGVNAGPETTAAVLASANQRIVANLVRQLEEEHDEREMHDVQHVLAFQQSRLEEETARRIESDAIGGQAGRTCHKILRRLPRAAGEDPVEAVTKLPSSSMDRAAAMAAVGRKIAPATANEESLSAHDHAVPTPLDEERLRSMLARLSSKDDGQKATDERKRLGLASPHPGAMAGTGAQPGRLDVDTGPHTATTPVAPRTNVPIAELLDPILSVDEDVPSAERLEQLKLVERVRDSFARARTKGGAPMHVPRSTIEKALLTPDDRPYEECMRLLPRPGSAFPSNPNPDAGKDKKKKGKKGGKKDKK